MTSDFIADKIVMDGLTFDDVLLVPAYSDVLPRTVSLATKFSRNIDLQIPFVTAAMDTVTESTMAIAIAREGGIGVIHKNMSIEDQARQVAIVKRAGSGDRYVYVYKDGKVSYNKVELGRRMDTEYELISGVDNNSQVVIAGQSKLADGVEVEVEK